MSSLRKLFSKLNAQKESCLQSRMEDRLLTVDSMDLCERCRRKLCATPSSPRVLCGPVPVSVGKQTVGLPDIVQDAVGMDRRITQKTQTLDWRLRFVLILAGDLNPTDGLAGQLKTFSCMLQQKGIPHVIVSSTSDRPLVWLEDRHLKELPKLRKDKPSLTNFVDACYHKARKILIAVSPGYVLYADEYVEGAQETKSTMQEIIRKQHERMKREFVSSTRLRLWPVLLHGLNTTRDHVPTFLSKVLIYWLGKKGTEDVAVVLEQDLQSDRLQRDG